MYPLLHPALARARALDELRIADRARTTTALRDPRDAPVQQRAHLLARLINIAAARTRRPDAEHPSVRP